MKKEDLISKGLTEEQISYVFSESGKDIKREQERAEKANQALESAIKEREAALEALKPFEGIDKAKYDSALSAVDELKKVHEAELAKMTRRSETKDFLSAHKFVNNETRDYYMHKLEAALDDEAYKGKNRKDILDILTVDETGKQRANIFIVEDESPNKATLPPGNPGGGAPEVQDPFSAKLSKYLK